MEPDYLLLVESVVHGILDREARGAAHAITQDDLTSRVRRGILAEGAEVPVGNKTLRRRVEEAVSDLATLTDIGVCSGSDGVFIAETVEEMDRGLATLRRHAISTFRRRRGLKRARARLLGQIGLPAEERAA